MSFVSADTSKDQQTNAPYFTVRVALPDNERRRLGDLQLVPGMPAEVFMQTGSRTMMKYLLQPIVEQIQSSICRAVIGRLRGTDRLATKLYRTMLVPFTTWATCVRRLTVWNCLAQA